MKKRYIVIIVGIMLSLQGFSQTRFDTLSTKLNELTVNVPELSSTVNISVSDVSIQEFLRAIAVSNKVNLDIDPRLNIKVVNNFNNVKVADVLLYLCKQYNLDLVFTGSIINVKPYHIKKKYVPKEYDISYEASNDLISFDFSNDTLQYIAKEITRKTNKNIIFTQEIANISISGYIQNLTFDEAIDKLAYANELEVKKSDDQVYLLSKKEVETAKTQGGDSRFNRTSQSSSGSGKSYINIKKAGDFLLSVQAVDFPVKDIITQASDLLNIDYFIVSPIEGNITLNSQSISYIDLLLSLLNGTEYTFKLEDNTYIIGVKNNKEISGTKVIEFQYRTIDAITEIVPADLKDNLEIVEIPEVNSIMVSGPIQAIHDLEKYIETIDQLIPVILIEVIIVDVSKSKTLSTGINAGLGDAPISTQGTIAPSIDFQLNANSLNRIINNFDGFGWLNIKNVTPNFYMTLKAMEDDGMIDIRSTPKLATLNGHEAVMSIGNTEYYLEEQNNVIGTQNPQLSTTKTYKPVEAQLALKIRPIVSGEDHITLNIEVDQSDFTGRISQFAPPGKVSRKFTSLIRVKNQEMILLGGLEEKRSTDSGTGLPFLARIPVIKWIFSSRTKADSKSKLSVFIRPTIIQ